MNCLSVRHLQKYYGKKKVLHDVSFDLAAGEILGFIGPNGAGKSTAMKCIAGLEKYQGGSIQIMGHDLAKERNEALAGIGLSIESPGLYPQLSGLEHLRYFGRLHGLPKSRVEEMADFSKLGKDIHRAAATYSMGMKQRLALALALLASPRLLLLDEPTNGLDPGAVFSLRREIRELRAQGIAILYSSHQLGELERTCDRMIFIREGRLIQTDALDRLNFRSYSFYMKDRDAAMASIRQRFPALDVRPAEDGAMEIRVGEDGDFKELVSHLGQKGLSVTSIHENAMSLEDRYAGLYRQ